MKIRLSQLRRIIRETLDEQGWVPGRWYPGDGEPVDSDDIELMDAGGLGRENPEDEDLNEASLTTKGLRKATYDEIRKRYPEFLEALMNRVGGDVARASFAISPQGPFGMGKIPLMAPVRVSDPVVYWDDGLKYNASASLADAIRDA